MASKPPPVGSVDFFRLNWDSIRDKVITPRNLTGLAGDGQHRVEFLEGMELLRLSGPRAKMDKRTKTLMTPRPAQLMIADAIEDADRFMGLLAPRRSTKTSALFAIAMGRGSNRPDYRIGYTMATTALKARDRFKQEIVAPLEFLYPDKATRPFVVNKAGGSESITWKSTGSVFQFLAPKGDSFRSDAWDLILVDEGGSADPDMAEDIMAGALATMDTVPDALMVIMGTAGKVRDGGLLWPVLEDGRAGRNRTSVIEWAAPPETKVTDILDADQEIDLAKFNAFLLVSHPGIGFGSTVGDIEPNVSKAKPEDSLREYLSIFSRIGGEGFLDQLKWASAAVKGALPPAPPTHFRLAFKVHPLQTSASIVATWREDGPGSKIHAIVIDQRKGVAWLKPRLLELARRYRTPVVYDTGNNVDQSVAEQLQRAKPKPMLEPRNWNQVSSAAATLVQQLETENVVHYDQAPLNDAIKLAVKRASRESKRWAFGRGADETADITALEAWALALHAYDESKPRVPLALVTAS
jgi:hypothetical protein